MAATTDPVSATRQLSCQVNGESIQLDLPDDPSASAPLSLATKGLSAAPSARGTDSTRNDASAGAALASTVSRIRLDRCRADASPEVVTHMDHSYSKY